MNNVIEEQNMETNTDRQIKPWFFISPAHQASGNRLIMEFNSEMANSLSDLILELAKQDDLDPDENHLYAFARQLQNEVSKRTALLQERRYRTPGRSVEGGERRTYGRNRHETNGH